MFSEEQLHQLKRDINNSQPVQSTKLIELVDQAIEQQATITKWYGFLSLIARSGSSWGARINVLLNEYLFGSTDEATITAARTLLERHKDQSVSSVLDKLNRLTAPLARR